MSQKKYGSTSDTNTDSSSSRDLEKKTPVGLHRYRDNGLTIFNYLNASAYLLSYVVVFFSQLFDLPDIGTVSAQYQTIITPVDWAFAIWGPIYGFELVFVIGQLLPKYRSTHSVLDGVSTWFVAACIFQSLWMFLFQLGLTVTSLVVMLLIEISLVALVTSQHFIDTKDNATWVDYLVLRFPFELHSGWITVATLLNINLCAVAYSSNPSLLLAMGIVSVGFILVLAALVLFIPREKPGYVIALVFVWSLNGIQVELLNPSVKIEGTFSREIINGMLFACFGANVIVSAMVVIRFAISVWSRVRDDKEKVDDSEKDNLLSDLDIEDNVDDSSGMMGSF